MLPYAALKTFGVIDIHMMDFNTRQTPDGKIDLARSYEITQSMLDEIDWCDILVFGREWLPQGLGLLDIAKKKGKKVIYDLDDNLLIVPDWNPAGRVYNHQQVKDLIDKFLNRVDYITVTHNDLANYFSRYKPTKILKNFVYVPFLQGHQNIVTKDPDIVMIGWAGSSTHLNDLLEIKPVIEDILRDFPRLVFTFLGSCPDKIKNIDKDRIHTLLGSPDLFGYYQLLGGLKLEIAIAPLCDDSFNQYKSNIKLLEYTACGYPCVASKVFEYKRYIEHRTDGLLAGKYVDWYNSLKALITNVEMRKQLVANAQTKLNKYCDIRDNCQKWLDLYSDFTGIQKETIKEITDKDAFTEAYKQNVYQIAWFGPVAEEKSRKRFIQQQINSSNFSSISRTFKESGINLSI